MADKEITTKKTGAKKEVPDIRAYSFFIVYNNPRIHGVAGIAPEEMVDMTNQRICEIIVEGFCNRKSKQAVALYCRSEGGLEHLHIVFSSENQMRLPYIKRYLGKAAHIRVTRGSKEQVEAYINKTGKFEEKGEIILGKAQIGEIQGSSQGQRTDLEVIRAGIESGLTWLEVVRLDDRFYDNRKMTTIKNMFYDKRLQDTPIFRDVKVHWVFGGPGSGKTGTYLDLCKEHGEENVYLIGGSNYEHPWDDYAGERILFLNEFRGQFTYSKILTYLEGYRVRLDARYTNVYALWDEVYIATPMVPEEVFHKMIGEADKKKDPIGQLLGRIVEMSYCYRVVRPTGSIISSRDKKPSDFYKFTIPGELYRKLKVDEKMGDKSEQMKRAAKIEYMLKYQQSDDSVEEFGIEPEEPKKSEESFHEMGMLF